MKKLDRKALRQIWENRENETLMNETIRMILTRRSVRKFKNIAIPKNILEM